MDFLWTTESLKGLGIKKKNTAWPWENESVLNVAEHQEDVQEQLVEVKQWLTMAARQEFHHSKTRSKHHS